MQLCECCIDFETCDLEKRQKPDPYTPCDSFERLGELSQERYEAIKHYIRDAKAKATTQAQERTYVNVDIALEIRADTYPYPFAFIQFLNADLTDEATRNEFINKYIKPFFPLSYVNLLENFGEQLQRAQDELISFTQDKGDLEVLNGHLAAVVPVVYYDQDGLKSQAIFRGAIPGALTQGSRPIALFFVQFAEFLLKKQELKRCPVCEDYFKRPKRGPQGNTCRKDKCKKAMMRDRGRYLKKE